MVDTKMLLRTQKREREGDKEGNGERKRENEIFFSAGVVRLQKIQIESSERAKSELCNLDNVCCIIHIPKMPCSVFVCVSLSTEQSNCLKLLNNGSKTHHSDTQWRRQGQTAMGTDQGSLTHHWFPGAHMPKTHGLGKPSSYFLFAQLLHAGAGSNVPQ